MHADHPHQPIDQGNGVKGARHVQPPIDRPRHLDLRRNDHVDRHVVAAEQVGPDRVQIALMSHPGDFGGHVEYRVRHLAGDHVDLVRLGHRDDHVGVGATGPFQYVRVRGEADERADVEGVADLLRQRRRLLDDGDVVVAVGQIAGDVEADLPGSANDEFHGRARPFRPSPPGWRLRAGLLLFGTLDAQGLELAMQRRAFHADERGGARDIAAEAIHLGHEILALEQLARAAKR